MADDEYLKLRVWGIIIFFSLIFIKATTCFNLIIFFFFCKSVNWFCDEFTRSQSTWKSSSTRSSFWNSDQEEEEWEELMERLRRLLNEWSKSDFDYKPPKTKAAMHPLSHHYSVLGLDRFRSTPYTEAEIKTAFRARAKKFHPDKNRDNTKAAEAKFKEVMSSYEAIQKERKNKL